jgi:hypothetical protein
MGPIDLLLHLIGFAAPALAVALAAAFGARAFLRRDPAAGPWWRDVFINFVVGTGVLAAGLWHFGVDGKMTSYAALVLAVAASQWACSRAWRG